MTMTWCFGDEATPASSAILDRLEQETAVVPSHWFLEVTNVLAMAERRKRITPKASSHFLGLLTIFDIEIDDDMPGRAFTNLLPLCRTHRLSSYDAVYLDLAARRHIPLASLDDDLCAAAQALGISVLGRDAGHRFSPRTK